ncbi:hypothetical protein EV356DRAFT_357504 [Viridothelium virens]|uniref:Tat pathway signal sequence n=1 Tax=Viridothelium virens TaxID=1048519 RepID=A0A6A6HJP6_VIRVR|nr:hypothetical protein EV356DRAFT_357504 [Viridothelium virens]
MGEPSWDGDIAWNSLLHNDTFRIKEEEAKRLDFTGHVRAKKGGYAGIIGVFHNLHCLRRLRQTLYADYYYPNQTEAQRERDWHHNTHCLESLRTSIMCHPYLTVFPYYWSGIIEHDLSAPPNAKRECINWNRVQRLSNERALRYSDIVEKDSDAGMETNLTSDATIQTNLTSDALMETSLTHV